MVFPVTFFSTEMSLQALAGLRFSSLFVLGWLGGSVQFYPSPLLALCLRFGELSRQPDTQGQVDGAELHSDQDLICLKRKPSDRFLTIVISFPVKIKMLFDSSVVSYTRREKGKCFFDLIRRQTV